MDIKNKRVTIVGLGNSGINAAILAADMGASVMATDGKDAPEIRKAVKAFDGKNIKYELGRHTKAFVEGSGLVVLSPGVEDSSLPVKWAMELKVPIVGEMELGYWFCKGKIIAITGTNGKSTVTTLIGEILKDGGLDTVVCGNIGNSLAGEIPKIKADTWVVLEVSSFQLEKIERFKPAISIILNITDDHMDRYTKFNDYYKEKLNIFRNQDKDDILILNYDALNLRGLEKIAKARTLFYSRLGKVNGAYMENGRLVCISGGKKVDICGEADIPIKGLHNVENVLASSVVGCLAGVSARSINKTIKKFKGLSHRVELVDTIDGVEYIDDSKGTTVDSTLRALESSTKPVILIAGGKDKNSNYRVVRGVVKDKVKHLILIGEAKGRIREALADVVDTRDAATMQDAVELAHGLAKEGYEVLLSPMCSSFDMYTSYKHRGDVFKEAVRSLKKRAGKIL
jgi:UDP-N-acetylmuramoylalanine--D-glutamate ligase